MGKESVYIIAEIGQNHQGEFETASKLIDLASQNIYHEGYELKKCDAVKFQIRDLNHELTVEAWQALYRNKNSFGETYGQHREYLELSLDDYRKLAVQAREKGLEVVVTICNPGIVDEIAEKIKPDRYKIASRDITNIPLIKKISTLKPKHVIFSSGFACTDSLSVAYSYFTEATKRSILYCVSEYPTQYEKLNFEQIDVLKKRFFGIVSVGFSDHTSGVLAPAVAVAHGAELVEKHITLNRQMKGSDHEGSMDSEGFRRCVRDIRNTEKMIGGSQKFTLRGNPVFDKETQKKWNVIGRSCAYKKDMEEGEKLLEKNIVMISPPSGMDFEKVRKDYIGKPVLIRVKKNATIKDSHFTLDDNKVGQG